jgi:hypothetical protein
MNNSTYLMVAILSGIAMLSTGLVVATPFHQATAQVVGYNEDDDGGVNVIYNIEQQQCENMLLVKSHACSIN